MIRKNLIIILFISIVSFLKFADTFYYHNLLFKSQNDFSHGLFYRLSIFRLSSDLINTKSILLILIANALALPFVKKNYRGLFLSFNLWGLFSIFHENNFPFNYPSFGMFCFAHLWYIFYSISKSEILKNDLQRVAWISVTFSMMFSAMDKWGTSSWNNGTALHLIAEMTLSKKIISTFFLSIPIVFQKLITYVFWLTEFISPTFIIFSKYRKYYLFYFIATFSLGMFFLEFYFIALDSILFFLILLPNRVDFQSREA